MENIGQRIKMLRKLLCLTQKEFGEKIGINDIATISKFEKEQREPDINRVSAMSKTFGVSIEWLITGLIHSELCDRITDLISQYGGASKNSTLLGVSERLLFAIRDKKVSPSFDLVSRFNQLRGENVKYPVSSDVNALQLFETEQSHVDISRIYELLKRDKSIHYSIYRLLVARRSAMDALSNLKTNTEKLSP
jgi:transcriptional regulator with XRE-family HTH domain